MKDDRGIYLYYSDCDGYKHKPNEDDFVIIDPKGHCIQEDSRYEFQIQPGLRYQLISTESHYVFDDSHGFEPYFGPEDDEDMECGVETEEDDSEEKEVCSSTIRTRS